MCLVFAGLVCDDLKTLLKLRPNRSSYYCLLHSQPLTFFFFLDADLHTRMLILLKFIDASLLCINLWTVFVVALSGLSYEIFNVYPKTNQNKLCSVSLMEHNLELLFWVFCLLSTYFEHCIYWFGTNRTEFI